MNISIATIKDYDKNKKQSTTNVIQNKPKQSQSFDPSTALRASSLLLRTGLAIILVSLNRLSIISFCVMVT